LSTSGCEGAGLLIGTSGWFYKIWKDDFYEGVAQKRWLSHYASRFNSVEVNATFYRLQKPATYEKWLGQTPDSFCFTVKGSRFVTHIKRLKDTKDSIIKQKDNLEILLPRLAAVVWQLPGNMEKDLSRLEDFAASLSIHWPRNHHVMEFRNSSWFDQDVAGLLDKYNLANCLSDSPNWHMWEMTLSGLAYVRLHGHTELYRSEYTEKQLSSWAGKAGHWKDQGLKVFIFFDNTDENHAWNDALRLKEMLG